MTAKPEPAGTISQKSPAERLLGVSDPKPEPAERPVARKRTAKAKPTPKPAPRTISFAGQDWDPDINPDGYKLATELAGGEQS